MQDAIKMLSSFISLLLQFQKSKEIIILSNIIMFHIQDEVEQVLFQGQLGWLFENAISFPFGACMINNDLDHKLHQFLELFQKEIDEGFKQTYHSPHGHHDVLHTYTRFDQLPTSILQRHWCEVFPSIDACNCNLYWYSIFCFIFMNSSSLLFQELNL